MTRPQLSKAVGAAFYEAFAELKPAQVQGVAPTLRGEDVLITSGSGSGKTEAIVAPIVQRHLYPAGRGGRSVLHFTPTRALANDLERLLGLPMKSLDLLVWVRHGERNGLARQRSG